MYSLIFIEDIIVIIKYQLDIFLPTICLQFGQVCSMLEQSRMQKGMHAQRPKPTNHIRTQMHHCFCEHAVEVSVITLVWQLGQLIFMGNLV